MAKIQISRIIENRGTNIQLGVTEREHVEHSMMVYINTNGMPENTNIVYDVVSVIP